MNIEVIGEFWKVFGVPGLLVAFMCWLQLRSDKLTKDREEADRILARERIETDKAIATAMATLAVEIRGMKH